MTLYYKLGKTAYKINPKKHPKLCSYLASKKDEVKKMYDDWFNDKEQFLFPRLCLYDANGYEVLLTELGIFNQKEPTTRFLEIFKDNIDEKNKIVIIYGQGTWNDKLFEAEKPEEYKKAVALKEAEKIKG